MLKPSPCPASETLSRLVQGQLNEHESQQLEQHLLECSECAKLADTLCPTGQMKEAISGGPGHLSDPQDHAAVEQAIERGRTLMSGNAADDTVVGPGPREASAPTITSSQPTTPPPADSDTQSLLHPPRNPDELGRLGGYRILEVLGRGGMGVVFRAEDPDLRRSVALKVMSDRLAADPLAKERFLQEARAAAAIEHDHIIQIYQVGEDNGVPFIAMPFLRGESLADRLEREGRLPQAEVVRIGKEIAAGLAAAHARGLIHRDIKPDNIWLQEGEDRVRIVDFGLVRSSQEDAGLTHTGMVLGTPRYMAPEQARGEAVDHRCDLFSLGSVLYRLASGRLPFSGSNLTATLIAVAQQDPQPIAEQSVELDAELSDLIMNLLAKSPADRPQSADEVQDRLHQLQQKMLAASPSATAAPPAQPQAQSSAGHQPPRRRTGLLLGGLGAIVLLLGGLLLKFRTEDGTVYVELGGDVQIEEVELDGRKVAFRTDNGSNRLSFEADAGQYTLTLVTAAGVELTTSLGEDPLRIKPGRDTTVRAWIEKKDPPDSVASAAAPTDDQQIDYAAQRGAAEWVLSVGGQLTVRDGEGKLREWVQTVPNGPFEIVKADLYGTNITASDLKKFVPCESLEHLVLGGHRLTGHGLRYLTELRDLVSLEILDGGLTDDDLKSFGELHQLRSLMLPQNPEITDEGLAHLTQLTNLEQISLFGAVTDFGLSLLPAGNLRDVRLQYTGVSDSGVARLLDRAPGIERLDLTDHRGIRTLQPLRRASALRRLDCNQSQLTASALEVLNELTQLKHLTVSQVRALIPFQVLADTNHVRLVDLFGSYDFEELPAGCYEALSENVGIEVLAVSGTRALCPDDQDLQALSALSTLRELQLDFSEPRFTPEGLAAFHNLCPDIDVVVNGKSSFPTSSDPDREVAEWVLSLPRDGSSGNSLVSVRTGDELVDVSSVSDLPKGPLSLERIHVLGVDGNRITEDRFRTICQLQNLESLVFYRLHSPASIAADDISYLSQSPLGQSGNLRHLTIESSSLTDQAIEPLNQLKSVVVLTLAGTDITDAGVGRLDLPNLAGIHFVAGPQSMAWLDDWSGRMPTLSEVTLENPGEPVPAEQLSLLEPRQQQLRYLRLCGCRLTDESVEVLGKMTEFTGRLDISFNPITDEGIQHLHDLTKLQSLDLRATKVTQEGVELLQRALPRCRIESNFDQKRISTADREVAEWVLSLPEGEKRTRYIKIGSDDRKIRDLKELPAEAFRITRVSIDVPGLTLTDADLQRFAPLAELQSLSLGHGQLAGGHAKTATEITDEGLDEFSHSAGAAKLTLFELHAPQLTNAAVQALNRVETLSTLHLDQAGITNEGLEALRLPELRDLALSQSHVTPDGLTNWNDRLPHLTSLTFYTCPFSSKPVDFSALENWSPSARYSQLRFDNTSLTDQDLAALAELTEFGGKLRITSSDRVTDQGLSYLAAMKKLRELELSGLPKVTEAAVRRLERELPATKVVSDYGPAPAPLISRPDYDPTPPQIPGNWELGPLPPWADGQQLSIRGGDVLPGILEQPATLDGIGRWNVDTFWPRGAVSIARYSPDGKWLALGSSDGHVRLYDSETFRRCVLLPGVGYHYGVQQFDWHPQSDRIAVVADEQQCVRIWDTSGLCLSEFDTGARQSNVLWLDADRLLITCDGIARREDRAFALIVEPGGDVLESFSHEDWQNSGVRRRDIALSPERTKFVCRHDDGVVRIWNIQSKTAQDLGQAEQPRQSVAWSEADWIAVANGPNIELYSPGPTRTLSQTIPFPGQGLCWDPSGEKLLAGGSELRVWDTRTESFAAPIDVAEFRRQGWHANGSSSWSLGHDWSPDGRRIVRAAGKLDVFDSDLSQRHFESPRWIHHSRNVEWSPDGDRLALAHSSGESDARVLSAAGEQVLFYPLPPTYPSIHWSPTGTALFTQSREGTVGLARVTGEAEPLQDIDELAGIGWLVPNATGSLWAAAANTTDDEPVIALLLPDGRLVRTIRIPGDQPFYLPGSPLRWCRATNRLYVNLNGIYRIDPDADWVPRKIAESTGSFIDISPDGSSVIDFQRGAMNAEGKLLEAKDSLRYAVAWRPDGRQYLASKQARLELHVEGGEKIERVLNTDECLPSTAVWNPTRPLIACQSWYRGDVDVLNALDLTPVWHAVPLPRQQMVSLSAAGQILDGEGDVFKTNLLYIVAGEDGRIETVSLPEFEERIGQPAFSKTASEPAVVGRVSGKGAGQD